MPSQLISPVRKSASEGYTNDYLTPVERTMTSYEMRTLYDGFHEIEATDPQLAADIIRTAFIQAGTGATVSSFLNTIPGESIMATLGGPLDNFLKNNDDIAEEIPNYYIEFFKNNHYDQNIVPKHNPYSKLIYPMTFVLDEKSRKEYGIALAKDEIPPPIRRGYIWNSEQGSQSITVLGSRNLNNYTGDIMIPSNKFKVPKPGGTKYNYLGYRKEC